MAQPTSSQVHVNRPLTNISIAYMQSLDNFIADKVFPVVPVDKQADIYTVYTKNDWLRDEAKSRAPGTESVGSGYNLDQSNTYFAGVSAIHKDVSDQIRANADSNLDIDRDATQFVTQRLMLRRERDWASSFFTTGVWGTDVVGTTNFTKWSDYASSTPITDIQTGTTTILKNTGLDPNTLVLGYETYAQLKNHPTIIDRTKHTTSESVTTAIMANLFDVERVLVAKGVYASNVEGETGVYAFTHGKNAMLCYSAPSPSLLQPSAGYIFAWRGISAGLGSSIAIKNFRIEERESDRIEGQFAWDSKVVGSDLGYFFSAAVA